MASKKTKSDPFNGVMPGESGNVNGLTSFSPTPPTSLSPDKPKKPGQSGNTSTSPRKQRGIFSETLHSHTANEVRNCIRGPATSGNKGTDGANSGRTSIPRLPDLNNSTDGLSGGFSAAQSISPSKIKNVLSVQSPVRSGNFQLSPRFYPEGKISVLQKRLILQSQAAKEKQQNARFGGDRSISDYIQKNGKAGDLQTTADGRIISVAGGTSPTNADRTADRSSSPNKQNNANANNAAATQSDDTAIFNGIDLFEWATRGFTTRKAETQAKDIQLLQAGAQLDTRPVKGSNAAVSSPGASRGTSPDGHDLTPGKPCDFSGAAAKRRAEREEIERKRINDKRAEREREEREIKQKRASLVMTRRASFLKGERHGSFTGIGPMDGDVGANAGGGNNADTNQGAGNIGNIGNISTSNNINSSSGAASYGTTAAGRAAAAAAERSAQVMSAKVIEVYRHNLGGCPRKVSVERKTRYYQSLDLEVLLAQRGVGRKNDGVGNEINDGSADKTQTDKVSSLSEAESDGVEKYSSDSSPNSSSTMSYLTSDLQSEFLKDNQWYPLAAFDNTEYATRSPQEWLALLDWTRFDGLSSVGFDVAGGKWRKCTAVRWTEAEGDDVSNSSANNGAQNAENSSAAAYMNADGTRRYFSLGHWSVRWSDTANNNQGAGNNPNSPNSPANKSPSNVNNSRSNPQNPQSPSATGNAEPDNEDSYDSCGTESGDSASVSSDNSNDDEDAVTEKERRRERRKRREEKRRKLEQDDTVKLNILQLLPLGEDPELFADRIAQAVACREQTRRRLLFYFYVDNMPLDGVNNSASDGSLGFLQKQREISERKEREEEERLRAEESANEGVKKTASIKKKRTDKNNGNSGNSGKDGDSKSGEENSGRNEAVEERMDNGEIVASLRDEAGEKKFSGVIPWIRMDNNDGNALLATVASSMGDQTVLRLLDRARSHRLLRSSELRESCARLASEVRLDYDRTMSLLTLYHVKKTHTEKRLQKEYRRKQGTAASGNGIDATSANGNGGSNNNGGSSPQLKSFKNKTFSSNSGLSVHNLGVYRRDDEDEIDFQRDLLLQGTDINIEDMTTQELSRLAPTAGWASRSGGNAPLYGLLPVIGEKEFRSWILREYKKRRNKRVAAYNQMMSSSKGSNTSAGKGSGKGSSKGTANSPHISLSPSASPSSSPGAESRQLSHSGSDDIDGEETDESPFALDTITPNQEETIAAGIRGGAQNLKSRAGVETSSSSPTVTSSKGSTTAGENSNLQQSQSSSQSGSQQSSKMSGVQGGAKSSDVVDFQNRDPSMYQEDDDSHEFWEDLLSYVHQSEKSNRAEAFGGVMSPRSNVGSPLRTYNVDSPESFRRNMRERKDGGVGLSQGSKLEC